MVDDKSVWEDPILEGWTDGSTDGSDSTDAPTADEENDTLVLDGKEHREEGKKEASKDGDLYDDPAKSKGDKESKFEDDKNLTLSGFTSVLLIVFLFLKEGFN